MINQQSQRLEDFSYNESLSYSSIEHNDVSLDISVPPIPQLDDPDYHYLCPKCHNFPLIEFLSEEKEYVKYKCSCTKEQKELVKIDDFFKNKITILNNKEFNSLTKDKIIGFKCTSHNSLKYNKFKYYCIACKKNICKECCQNHLDKNHDIVVFDYQNFEMYKKIKDINEYLNSESIKNNEKIVEGYENSKDNNNKNKMEIEDFKFIKTGESTLETQSKKRMKEILDYHIKLIKIIISDFLMYPNYYHFYNLENIHRVFAAKISKKEIKKDISDNRTIHVIFHFNRMNPTIHCNIRERFKEIQYRLFFKMNPEKEFVLYYNGNVIKEELAIEKVINEYDKERKTMDIYVKEMKEIENIKLTNIICPVCCEEALLKIDNYKINLYDCKNGHETNQILFKNFMSTQKVDLSRIICDNCKIVNKFNDNSFFECFTCGQNLCSSCKSNHNNKHDIINYEIKNYICHKHKEFFSLYCENCKKNICIKCENDHRNHSKLNYKDYIKSLYR